MSTIIIRLLRMPWRRSEAGEMRAIQVMESFECHEEEYSIAFLWRCIGNWVWTTVSCTIKQGAKPITTKTQFGRVI